MNKVKISALAVSAVTLLSGCQHVTVRHHPVPVRVVESHRPVPVVHRDAVVHEHRHDHPASRVVIVPAPQVHVASPAHRHEEPRSAHRPPHHAEIKPVPPVRANPPRQPTRHEEPRRDHHTPPRVGITSATLVKVTKPQPPHPVVPMQQQDRRLRDTPKTYHRPAQHPPQTNRQRPPQHTEPHGHAAQVLLEGKPRPQKAAPAKKMPSGTPPKEEKREDKARNKAPHKGNEGRGEK